MNEHCSCREFASSRSSENWDGLLDPLDLNLRTLILRSGNFCQATYDAFNNDQNSKYCGSSRYGEHSFFDKHNPHRPQPRCKSLATLSAFDLVENGVSDIPVAAFIFQSPQVGNKAFKSRIERYPNLKILHTTNTIDLVPPYPSGLPGYVDVGMQLVIDSRKSPFLKESKNVRHWHNLEGVLHVVAGWNGEERERVCAEGEEERGVGEQVK
ncbi:hypothetical protein ACFX19_026202 [Malus domestica]